MIKAENLQKSYNNGNVQVLKGIDLEIADGEFAVILGASGSGKSTLLSLLSGLERADKGSVYHGEVNISQLNEKGLTEFRRKNVGFIFQQYYLLPNLNMENNVKMGAALSSNKSYKEIISAVGLEEKIKNKPSQLSGGEQQRVCIARALAKEPNVLFLDEPTGALDEKTGREILDYIIKLKNEKRFTMIIVTHNANIAEMADVVIKMNSGLITEIVRNKTPKSALEIGW